MSRIIITAVIAGIFLIMAVAVLAGKGDGLIAGYNTAGEKEQARYDMPRLRGLLAAVLLCSAALMLILLLVPSLAKVLSVAFLVLLVVGVVLANTWAKKN